MSDNYLGQITLYGCNFAPQGWAMCQGQILPISQYSALFALLGTQFGGNGTSNFALPDLRSRVPNGQGTLVGGSTYVMGELGGMENVTLTTSTIPPHNHGFIAYTGNTGQVTSPAGALPAAGAATGGRGQEVYDYLYNSNSAATVALAAGQVVPASGGGQGHNNIQPVLALNWCIALTGVFPARS